VHPLRRAQEPLAIGVLADLGQDPAHGLLDPTRRAALSGRARACVAVLDLLHDLAHAGFQVVAISLTALVIRHDCSPSRPS